MGAKTKNTSKTEKSKQKNKNKGNKKKEINSSDFKFYKNKMFYFILIVIGGGGSILLYNYLKPEKVYKMSEIIRLYVNISDKIVENENQMKLLLLEDPTLPIIKENLRPIQARISSLRTQTSQYEQMEQIPGGPTSFIESSLQELDAIGNNQLEGLNQAATLSIASVVTQMTALAKKGNSLLKENTKTTDENVIKLMAIENFFIYPSPEEIKEIEGLAKNNYTTMSKARRKFIRLAEKYEQLAEMYEKLASKLGYSSGAGLINYLLSASEDDWEELEKTVDVDKIIKMKEEIDKDKERDLKTFKVFMFKRDQLLQKMHSYIEHLQNFEHEKRQHFTNLHKMVVKDIANLKIRIKNLKYKYVKTKINSEF